MWMGRAPTAKENPASFPEDIPFVQMLRKCLDAGESKRPSANEFLLLISSSRSNPQRQNAVQKYSYSNAPHYETKDVWTAAYDGDVIALEESIRKGADINGYDSRGRTPLHWICYVVMDKKGISAHVDCARMLVSMGADSKCRTKGSGNIPEQILYNRTSQVAIDLKKVLRC